MEIALIRRCHLKQIKNRSTTVFLMLFIWLGHIGGLHADIYMYVDPNGVMHFSNIPTSSKYEVYLRERSLKPVRSAMAGVYDKYIFEASEKYGVPASLLKAVIRVESNFNPWAVSRKGAKGLMQIMPDNFKMLEIKDPFDPRENIMGGTKYLKKLLNKYRGKQPLALAAYNAGPQAVNRFNRIPPYKETENYVKKVMKFYHIYKNS
jgi:soluble lytic murein transglycosylase-like protein